MTCDICICQLQQVVYVGLVCFLCATLGQQLKFVQQEQTDYFEEKLVSDKLQWHDNNIHKQELNQIFKHQVENDFVEMVHIVFMNHLGMLCCYCAISQFLSRNFVESTKTCFHIYDIL